MPDNNASDKIIEHLDSLNKQVARQNSFGRMFVVGICYGIGFVIGSAIIASILVGILAPLVSQVPWVRAAFEAGVGLIHSK